MTDTPNHNPRDELDAAIDLERLANPVIDHPDGRRHIFVPDGYHLQDCTSPDRMRDHIRAEIIVDDRLSLSQYANRFSEERSILLADYDRGTITAHLDWHHGNANGPAPSHAAHSATLRLRDSEEYKRWNKMEGELHNQSDFALFIEENVADLTSPDHSDMLEICRELEVSQGAKFRSATRLDNGDRAFTYETETQVKSEMTVPTEIALAIPLYQGEEPAEIRAKFRFRPSPDGLKLGFVWHRVEYMRQAKFAAMAHQAAEETGLPVFFGR